MENDEDYRENIYKLLCYPWVKRCYINSMTDYFKYALFTFAYNFSFKMVSIYFCIYVCPYPLQSMPASWIWLILRRKAVEGPRRLLGHAKETRGQGTERCPQHHLVMGCIFHKDIGGHPIVHPMCFLQRNTATPPSHLVALIDLNRKVT